MGWLVLVLCMTMTGPNAAYALPELLPKISKTDQDHPAHSKEPTQKEVVPLPAKGLRLYSLHTHETIDVIFWDDGNYVKEGLKKLNHFLRDHRTQNVTEMDPELFMLLHAVYVKSGSKEPIHVISGYRSSKTNKMLRMLGRKVGEKSQHIEGKAIDIRIPGVPLPKLRAIALELGVGGVGYYSKDNFVHIDTGKPRVW